MSMVNDMSRNIASVICACLLLCQQSRYCLAFRLTVHAKSLNSNSTQKWSHISHLSKTNGYRKLSWNALRQPGDFVTLFMHCLRTQVGLADFNSLTHPKWKQSASTKRAHSCREKNPAQILLRYGNSIKYTVRAHLCAMRESLTRHDVTI